MSNNFINLGLIAARSGSKGVPGKNLIKIKGKELVKIAAEIGQQTKEIDYVICSTDSEEIAAVAINSGIEAPFIRPSYLAEDDTPILPVMEHAIKWLEANTKMKIASVTIIDPTAPLRTSKDMSDVINLFKIKKADLAISVHKCHQNPYFNMLEKKKNGFFNLPLGMIDNYGSRQSAPEVFAVNTICWVYSRKAILDEKMRIPKNTIIKEFPENRSTDIDTLEDLKRINIELSI